MSSNQASTLFTAPPTTFFAVLCTTLSILLGPARKLYLQLILMLHIAFAPFVIITVVIMATIRDIWITMLIWLLFAVLIAPCLYTYLCGNLIYGVGKVYAGEVQLTRDSKWMSRLSISQLWTVFLYALIVIGICGEAPGCIGLIFDYLKNEGGPMYISKSDIILKTLAVILIIPLAGMLLVAFIALLFERDVSFKQRLHNLCKENFCFIYTKFLGYIFGVMLLLALSLHMTYIIGHGDHRTFYVYYWIVYFMLLAITSILPIVLYMSIRVQNEELTQESFADDIGLSGSGDIASPLIPQGDEPSQRDRC